MKFLVTELALPQLILNEAEHSKSYLGNFCMSLLMLLDIGARNHLPRLIYGYVTDLQGSSGHFSFIV